MLPIDPAHVVSGESSHDVAEHHDAVEDTQLVQSMFEAIRRYARSVPGEVQSQIVGLETRAMIYMREFQRMRPPRFSGQPDPVAAESWLEQVTTVFDTLYVVEEHLRVTMAAYQLIDEAAEWWKMMKNTTAVADMTWDEFRTVFLNKYFPPVLRDQKRVEFLTLTQGDMTVAQYEARFTLLSRYAREVISTEVLKVRQFEQGLRPSIRDWIEMLRLMTYQEVVERAIIVEHQQDIRIPTGGSGGQSRKRRRDDPGSSQTWQGPTSGSSSYDTITPRQIVCYGCQQPGHRRSECPQRRGRTQSGTGSEIRGRCFQCGQVGHLRRDCPGRSIGFDSQALTVVQSTPPLREQRPPQMFQPVISGQASRAVRGATPASSNYSVGKQGAGSSAQLTQGRVFTVTAANRPSEAGVIRGMIPVFNSWARVLIDSGASHSFIALSFVLTLGLAIEQLDLPLFVDTPVGDRIVLQRVCRSCEVGINQHRLVFDFVILDMIDFDVILGMDWLSTFRAVIDCYHRRVTVCTPEGNRFYFLVDRQDTMVSCVQSQQKSYAERRKRPLEFEVGDHVFLRIAPYRGLMRSSRRGKLSPRFVGPFEILERIEEVAYRLALPPQLSRVHNVFHVSMLRKYEPEPSHVLDWAELEVDEDITYEERPIQILDRREQVLRGKTILLVMVRWQYHGMEEATWEREDEVRTKYPDIFTAT